MLFARQAPRWRRRRLPDLSPATTIDPKPTPAPDPTPDPTPTPVSFIPADADWWFDASRLSDATIASWNNDAAKYSYNAAPAKVVDLTKHGMPGKLRLKNDAVKPRCVASGPNKGAVRAVRCPKGGKDPTGGPTDTKDWQELDAAHNLCAAIRSNGELWTLPYGRLFEVGFKFLVPAPSDADLAAFNPPGCQWTIIWEWVSSDNRTTECWGVRLNHYANAPQQILLQSGYSAGGKEQETYWGPNGTYFSPGISKGEFPSNLGKPWVPNRWYAIRIRGVIDKETGKNGDRGWADMYIDDMKTPFSSARNARCGKSDDVEAKASNWGQYSDYDLRGFKRCIYFDQMYIKLGATGYPSAPK
ncbi:MAG: hypothetical protein IPM60_07855 [Rhodospirillales bacterium]|nr:hypothetical protein [Rhodospirillales bacterium]